MSVCDRKLKKAATPLYSSSDLPPKTQRLAPPGMVFCGAPSALRIVGKLADAVVHARLDDVAETARGFGEDAAFAGEEDLLGLGGAAAVLEGAVLGEIGDLLEVLDEESAS